MEIKKYTPSEGELEALRIIKDEKAQWDEGLVFVTDKVQFVMKNVVKKARKNFFGIFNQSKDPVTGREKIFVPFTEQVVETVLKNIDIDTKDINVKARNPKGYLAAQIFRMILRKSLDDISFGKTINRFLRKVTIDGTAFLKVQYEESENELEVSIPDRLNMIYDPTAEDLDDSAGITERHILTLPEFQELGLDKSEYVEGSPMVNRTGFDNVGAARNNSTVPFVEVFERYGYLPKFCISGKEEDKRSYVYCKAIVTGLNHEPVIHSIEEVEEHPYGMFKFKEVPNRADGRGIPEMLFSIQAYLNEVVNTRMNKARVVHMGLWEVRGNVTPQKLKRLFTTGAIKLGENDSVVNINTGSIDPSSYKDEEQAYTWGTRVTQTTMEDEVDRNRPATNALINQQGSAKGYNLRMEDLFLDLEKFMEEKMVPIIKKMLKPGDIMRIVGDVNEMKQIDEALARNYVYSQLQEKTQSEIASLTPEDVDAMVQMQTEELAKQGQDRYPEVASELFDFEYDLDIQISDEQLNKALIAQQLDGVFAKLMGVGMTEQATEVMKEIFDTLGLDAERLVKKPLPPAPGMPGMDMQGAQLGAAQPGLPQPSQQINPVGA